MNISCRLLPCFTLFPVYGLCACSLYCSVYGLCAATHLLGLAGVWAFVVAPTASHALCVGIIQEPYGSGKWRQRTRPHTSSRGSVHKGNTPVVKRGNANSRHSALGSDYVHFYWTELSDRAKTVMTITYVRRDKSLSDSSVPSHGFQTHIHAVTS